MQVMLSLLHRQREKFVLLISALDKAFGVYVKDTQNILFLATHMSSRYHYKGKFTRVIFSV